MNDQPWYPEPGEKVEVFDDDLGTMWGTAEEDGKFRGSYRVTEGMVGQVVDHTAWGTEDEWYEKYVRVEFTHALSKTAFLAWVAVDHLMAYAPPTD